MRGAWQCRLRRVGALLLAVALLVPLGLQGHAHADDAAARSCATCVVTHTPLAPATAVAAPLAVLVATPVVPAAFVAPPAGHRPFAVGRAPPVLLVGLTA